VALQLYFLHPRLVDFIFPISLSKGGFKTVGFKGLGLVKNLVQNVLGFILKSIFLKQVGRL
jgi:hypothetical protein